MGLRKVFQVTSHSDYGRMSVGTAGLAHHPREISTIDLRQLVLCHDDIKLYLTKSISCGLSAVGDSDRAAAQFFEEAFHDQSRDRVVFTNENIQRAEKWPVLEVEL